MKLILREMDLISHEMTGIAREMGWGRIKYLGHTPIKGPGALLRPVKKLSFSKNELY